jgi:hypothetical protein
VRFFAMQSIDLGSHPSEWNATTEAGTSFFYAGFNLDCALRPGGGPMSCQPSGPAQPSWVSLPDGTDNAFAAQILAPLLTGPMNIDVQGVVNKSITGGEWSWIVVIDGWSGGPDDARVGVRLLQAQGPAAGGAPTWAADETWTAYADAWDTSFPAGTVPDTPFKTHDAYVTGGVLVWDMRGLPQQTLRVRNGAAVLSLTMEPVGFYGQLTDGSIQQLSIAGLLPHEILPYSLLDLASGCDPTLACQLQGPLYDAVASVQDAVSLTTPGQTFCNRISFGADPYLVRMGGVANIVPTTTQPASCDVQRQLLSCGDAGEAGTD